MKANPFVPRLEALEDRCCPSASIVIQGHTMIIHGSDAADIITVRDDGHGAVTASVQSPSGLTKGQGSDIRAIAIYGGKGGDKVDFALTGQLVTNLNLAVHLGKGGDTASLDFGAGINADDVDVDVDGGSGNDLVTAKVGNVTGSNLSFADCLGAGADMLDLTLQGKVTGHSHVKVTGNAGTGNDSEQVHATGLDIGDDSTVAVTLNGGKGSDNLGLTYDGVLRGKLTVNLNGGNGADTLVGNITAEAGSTGTLNAFEHGGKGSDNLTLNVYDNSNPGGPSKLADLDAVIYGGPGHNTFTHTPNVKVVK
jgi:hypothetical protein